MKVFVSYNRSREPVARSLVEDIEALGHSVWFDRDLSGGQAWWERILKNIRECEVFAIVADKSAVSSAACRLEASYASDLGKLILPVVVEPNVPLDLLPIELASLQVLDYSHQDKQAVLALSRALASLPPPKPLPEPLPAPPEAPTSHLGAMVRKIDSAAVLTYDEQSALTFDLERAFQNQEPSSDVRTLLERLRARRELYAVFAERLDSMLQRAPRRAPPARIEPRADPEPQVGQDSGASTGSVGPPPLGASQGWRGRFWGASLGALLGLAIALVLAVVEPDLMLDEIIFLFFPIAAGLVSGAATGSDRRSLRRALAITLSLIVGGLAFFGILGLAEGDGLDSEIVVIVLLVGLPLAALATLGLEIEAWFWRRRERGK